MLKNHQIRYASNPVSAVAAQPEWMQLAKLHDLENQVKLGCQLLTLGDHLEQCPMHDWHNLLTGQRNQKSKLSARWFSSKSSYSINSLTNLKFDLNFKKNTFWLSKKKIIEQAQAIYPNFNLKYNIPGPLTYLWFNEYLGESRILTAEKIMFLPNLISQYKSILQEFKNLDITWVQLADPVFITDILPDYQEAIISAYQDLLADAPKVMLSTYFGGIDENIHWIKKIPMNGLHLDLENAPEQIMFVLKNEIMSHLEVLSLGGIKRQESQFLAIQNFINNLGHSKPELWLSLEKLEANFHEENVFDVVKLYLNLDNSTNCPKILLFKEQIKALRAKEIPVQFLTETLSDLTCFVKKRDQTDLIQNLIKLSQL